MIPALTMPLPVQVTLALGAIGYFVAYRGIRSHHTAIDTAVMVLVFSFAGRLAVAFFSGWKEPYGWLAMLAAMITTGAVWRLVGIDLAAQAARGLDVSWSDELPSAWLAFHANSRWPVSQLSVLVEDGTWLSCDDTKPFVDCPFGPFTLGVNGDIAMYLTHEKPKDKERRQLTVTILNGELPRITHIPAGQVKRVHMRFAAAEFSRLNRLAAAVGRVCCRPFQAREPSA